jgi:chromosome condensin MukBEF ATPase and DNA-binding subunit MukB
MISLMNADCPQKLQDIARKRMNELKEPASVKLPGKKALDVSSSPQEILAMMDQLKDKVAHEADGDERNRLIARIQALHASYEQLTAPKDSQGGGSTDTIKATLQAELDKHTQDLKVIKEKEAEQRQQLDDLHEKLGESQPHIDKLRKERETCLDVVRNLREKINAIHDEWQGKFDVYKSAMDAWVAERKEVQKEWCVFRCASFFLHCPSIRS